MYRETDGPCKHAAIAQFEVDDREMSVYVDEADVPYFREFV